MDNLLPLLILILIPVLRGLNNSKKQKQHYQEKTKNVQTFPSQKQKPRPGNPFKSIIDELNRELKKEVLGEQEPEKKERTQNKQIISDYNKAQDENEADIMSQAYQKSRAEPVQIKKEDKRKIAKKDVRKKVTKKKNTKNNSLNFSRDPLVQGIIFSEILGPPKSKR